MCVFDLEFGDRSKFKVQSSKLKELASLKQKQRSKVGTYKGWSWFKVQRESWKFEVRTWKRWEVDDEERGREKVKKLRLFIPLARNLGYPRITHSDVNRPITPNIKINIQSQLSHFGDL